MATGAGSNKILTSDTGGNASWQSLGSLDSGDITAVYADDGLSGGGTSGETHISVRAGTGIITGLNDVQFDQSYGDNRYVNETDINGTLNYVPRYTGAGSLGNSIMYQDGTTLKITVISREDEPQKPGDDSNRERLDRKMDIVGENGETFFAELFETNDAADGRAAIYGFRNRLTANDGSGYDINETNNAITGYNYWGDHYTFGVSGYTYGDFNQTGGVIGYHHTADVWGSLGYEDTDNVTWGVYTPNKMYAGEGLNVNSGHVVIGTEMPDDDILEARGDPGYGGAVEHFVDTSTSDELSYAFRAGCLPSDGIYNGYCDGGIIYGADRGLSVFANPGAGFSYYVGVYGAATGGGGVNYGILGEASDSDTGENWGGYFIGDVNVSGDLYYRRGGFRIDNPMDPAETYLNHSTVNSPEMKNVYDGNVILDARGEAVVELPDYFEALNQDFRYQLTCIGGFAPVFIADKINSNRFSIAGGQPGMEVSWQVTGIRHDPVAEANRVVVEEDKKPFEVGKYLNPEAYGLPRSMAVYYDIKREDNLR